MVWRGAPAAKQLTLTPSNKSGLQSFDPVPTDGEATLVLPNDGSLSANWTFTDGSSMQVIWSPEAWAATGELTMDLSDWRSSSVQLSGDLPPTDCWSERGAELVLLPLRPPFGALRAHTLVALRPALLVAAHRLYRRSARRHGRQRGRRCACRRAAAGPAPSNPEHLVRLDGACRHAQRGCRPPG